MASYDTPDPKIDMVAGGPDSGLNSTLSNNGAIPLTRTPKGWIAFDAVFQARLGQNLEASLEYALENDITDPADAQQTSLFKHIYRRLIIGLANEPDLIATLAALFPSKNGVKAYIHLRDEFVGQTLPAEVKNVFSIVNTNLQTDTVSGVQNMLSTNLRLETPFPSKLLAALVLSKMPNSLATFRDIILEKDTMPTPQNLLLKLKQHAQMYPDAGHSKPVSFQIGSRGNSMICFNCGAKDAHITRDCKLPRADCDECGKAAGHLTRKMEWCKICG